MKIIHKVNRPVNLLATLFYSLSVLVSFHFCLLSIPRISEFERQNELLLQPRPVRFDPILFKFHFPINSISTLNHEESSNPSSELSVNSYRIKFKVASSEKILRMRVVDSMS